jgi:hypothetical protein
LSASKDGENEENDAGCHVARDMLWGRYNCQANMPASAKVAPPMAIIQKYLKFRRMKRNSISTPAVRNIRMIGKSITIGLEYCIRNVAPFLGLQIKYKSNYTKESDPCPIVC